MNRLGQRALDLAVDVGLFLFYLVITLVLFAWDCVDRVLGRGDWKPPAR